MRRSRHLGVAVVAATLVLSGCTSDSAGGNAARPIASSTPTPSPVPAPPPTAEAQPTPEATAEPAPTPSPAPPARIDVNDHPTALDTGSWHVDLGLIEASFTAHVDLKIDVFRPGALLMSGPESRVGQYEGVGIYLPSELLGTTAGDVTTQRFSPSLDLGPWLQALEGIESVDSFRSTIGGHDAMTWEFVDPGDCNSCFRFLWRAGSHRQIFATADDFRWQVHALEIDGHPVFVAVEARTERFDAFAASMQPWIDSLTIEAGGGTGSLWRPDDARAATHAIGRIELRVIDDSRTTERLERFGELILDDGPRELLVSVGYPATGRGGFDAPPAAGRFPLIISAPGLGDEGSLSPIDDALVTSGHVVASIRFPESSHPVRDSNAIREQPADITSVLDALLNSDFAPQLTEMIDETLVGGVGISMGGTTLLGVHGAACCLDERIQASILHAPTVFEFDDGLLFDERPMLVIAGTADSVAPVGTAESLSAANPHAISLFVFERATHVDWLAPSNARFPDAVALTRAFFDEHLNDGSSVSETAAIVQGGWTPAIDPAGLFAVHCASCHGDQGLGTDRGPSLEHSTQWHPAEELEAFVTDGRRLMPAFGGILSESEVTAVVQYVIGPLIEGGHADDQGGH